MYSTASSESRELSLLMKYNTSLEYSCFNKGIKEDSMSRTKSLIASSILGADALVSSKNNTAKCVPLCVLKARHQMLAYCTDQQHSKVKIPVVISFTYVNHA